jgi:hypothetical protein
MTKTIFKHKGQNSEQINDLHKKQHTGFYAASDVGTETA